GRGGPPFDDCFERYGGQLLRPRHFDLMEIAQRGDHVVRPLFVGDPHLERAGHAEVLFEIVIAAVMRAVAAERLPRVICGGDARAAAVAGEDAIDRWHVETVGRTRRAHEEIEVRRNALSRDAGTQREDDVTGEVAVHRVSSGIHSSLWSAAESAAALKAVAPP